MSTKLVVAAAPFREAKLITQYPSRQELQPWHRFQGVLGEPPLGPSWRGVQDGYHGQVYYLVGDPGAPGSLNGEGWLWMA